MDASLAVVVALADGRVESGSPGQVPDGQERDRGLHAHAGPQQVLQGLGREAEHTAGLVLTSYTDRDIS